MLVDEALNCHNQQKPPANQVVPVTVQSVCISR